MTGHATSGGTSPQLRADLTGHGVLVTGGVSGIGLACVELFASMGAKVAVNHLADDDRAPAVLAELRGRGYDVIDAPGDVSDAAATAAMVERALRELGHLDWLVNNAGVSLVEKPIPFSDLAALTDEFWQGILSVNLFGAYHCTRAAADALRARCGAVVNVSSSAHDGRMATSIPYGVSKGALTTLTRSLAKALAPEVRVNSVAPGYVTTPMTASRGPEHRARAKGMRLLNRLGTPKEIAEVVLFLCVSAGYVTGEQVVVDGGKGY